MGGQGSKPEGLAWGVTMQRRKKAKKNYSRSQLASLSKYLEENISQLRDHLRQLQTAKDGWQKEYFSITEGINASAEASKLPKNEPKNRYLNIVAFDHSRVKITPNQHNGDSDYVNANFIRGFNKEKAYIAAQGPVPDSMHDFWQMVWEHDVRVVAMVANEVEGGKLKCHKYWPDPEQTERYGGFELTCLDEHARSTSIIRRFKLTSLDNGEHYTLTQIQFIVWPDHGVPNTAAEILSFREEIYKEMEGNSPLLIHCSAGVGRTGTYIAIDRLINAAESMSPKLSVRDVVADMRSDRNYMVQTLVQYGYIYLAVLDAMQKGLQQVRQALAALDSDEAEKAEVTLETIEDEMETQQETTRGYQLGEASKKYETLYRETKGKAPEDLPDVSVAAKLSQLVRHHSQTQQAPPKSEEPSQSIHSGWVSLEDRIKAFRDNVGNTVTYSSASQQWQGKDSYDVKESLDPEQSRIAIYAQQQTNWETRGENFREQLRQEAAEQLATLEARVQNLKDNLESSSTYTKPETDTGVVSTSLADRVAALKAVKPSQASFGRVLDDAQAPKPVATKKAKAKKTAKGSEEGSKGVVLPKRQEPSLFKKAKQLPQPEQPPPELPPGERPLKDGENVIEGQRKGKGGDEDTVDFPGDHDGAPEFAKSRLTPVERPPSNPHPMVAGARRLSQSS